MPMTTHDEPEVRTPPRTVKAFDRKTRKSTEQRIEGRPSKIEPYDFTENDGVAPRTGAMIRFDSDSPVVLVYEQSFEEVCNILGYTPPKPD